MSPTRAPGYVIELPQGSLAIHDLTAVPARDDAAVVLAVHGITGNGAAWRPLADEVAARHGDRVRVLAPDLRARAASRAVPGPYGIGAHADDLLEIARVFGTRPLLVGHSMGAYVTALAAARSPERFGCAILVDGGFSFPAPVDLDLDAAISAVIGPAMTRLSMTFASLQDYLDFWKQHPALGPVLAGPHAQMVRDYLAHDLVPVHEPTPDGPGADAQGTGPWRSSCVLDAVRADGAGVLADPDVHDAPFRAHAAGVPLELVWARRGLLDEPQGLYDEQRLEALELPDGLPVHEVDANHYTVIWDRDGVTTIVDALDRQLPSS